MRLIIEGAASSASPLADVFTNLQEEADYIRVAQAVLGSYMDFLLEQGRRRKVEAVRFHFQFDNGQNILFVIKVLPEQPCAESDVFLG